MSIKGAVQDVNLLRTYQQRVASEPSGTKTKDDDTVSSIASRQEREGEPGKTLPQESRAKGTRPAIAKSDGRGLAPSSDNFVYDATAGLKPTITYKEKAKYTEVARQKRVQGTVILRATLTSDGRVTDVKVLKGLPDGLNGEAIKALEKLRFTPATRNGRPVSVRMSIEFAFNLL